MTCVFVCDISTCVVTICLYNVVIMIMFSTFFTTGYTRGVNREVSDTYTSCVCIIRCRYYTYRTTSRHGQLPSSLIAHNNKLSEFVLSGCVYLCLYTKTYMVILTMLDSSHSNSLIQMSLKK